MNLTIDQSSFDALVSERYAEHCAAYGITKPFTAFGNSEDRPVIVLRWAAELLEAMQPPEAAQHFWAALIEEWPMFDLIDHSAFGRLFRLLAPWRPPEMLASLPDRKIKVYRGQDARKDIGLSWTTNPDVARAFARGHRGIFNRYPVVLTTAVRSSDITFCTDERSEAEVVLLRRPRRREVFDTTEAPPVARAPLSKVPIA